MINKKSLHTPPSVRKIKKVKVGQKIGGYKIIKVNPFNAIGVKGFDEHCQKCKRHIKMFNDRSCKGCADINQYKKVFTIGDLVTAGVEPFCENAYIAAMLTKHREKEEVKINDKERKATNTFMGMKIY